MTSRKLRVYLIPPNRQSYGKLLVLMACLGQMAGAMYAFTGDIHWPLYVWGMSFVAIAVGYALIDTMEEYRRYRARLLRKQQDNTTLKEPADRPNPPQTLNTSLL